MQKIISFTTALLIVISGFCIALPHTFMLNSQKPGESVTDIDEVIALYKEVAAANTETKFRDKIAVGLESQNAILNSIVAASFRDWQDPIEITDGLFENCGLLVADDLVSAKAEYYRGGKTAVITLVPKEAAFNQDQTELPSFDHTIYPLLEGMSDALLSVMGEDASLLGALKSPFVQVVVDTKTKQIVAADIHYELAITVSGSAVEGIPLPPMQITLRETIAKP